MKCILMALLIFSFGESLNKFLKHYEPLNYETADLHRVARSTEERIRLNFHAYGRDFKLILHRVEEKDSVFMKDATVEFANETKTIEWDSNIFRGTVEDEERSHVFGSIRHGIFEGVIDMTNGDEFWIESSYPYNSTSSFHSFIYSANDVEMPKPTERTKRQGWNRNWMRPGNRHGNQYGGNNGNYDGNHPGNDPGRDTYGRHNSPYGNGYGNHGPYNRHSYPPYGNGYDNNNPFNHHNFPPYGNGFDNNNPSNRHNSHPYENGYVRPPQVTVSTKRPFKLCEEDADLADTPPNNFQQNNPDVDENGIYKNRICLISVTIDHTLYEYVLNGDGRGDHGETYTELKSILQTQFERVNLIYGTIDFGGILGIQFKIGGLSVWRSVEELGNPFVRETTDHGLFLDWHSKKDHSKYCLSYVFTYRDFKDFTQGLAYRCYLCTTIKVSKEDRSYNTGMISFRAKGEEIPERTRHLTLAHELGHSLGSHHDHQLLLSGKLESEEHPDCYSDGNTGHFIMDAHASNGNLPNNQIFSPCSIRNITKNLKRLLSIKPGTPNDIQTNCFIEAGTPICGNSIIEGDEQCDCGYNDHECKTQARDECCWPGDHEHGCKLKDRGYQCSPSQGKCCDEQCKYKGADAICEGDKDCSHPAKCLAMSAVCPKPKPAREGLPCNDAMGSCLNGKCNGSICAAAGLEPCEPTEVTCLQYCSVEGKCTSTDDLDQFTNGTYRQHGRWGHKGLLKQANEICKNGGYCDDIGVCRDMITNDALTKGKVDHGIHTFGEILAEKWWIFIIVIVVCIAILVLCILLLYYKLPNQRSPRETKTIPIEMKTAVELKATDSKAKPATPDPSKVTGTVAPSTLTGQWIIPESKEKKGGK